MKSKTVLLTGGAGYIGSHTALRLLCCGYEVIIADNYSNSKPEAPKRVGELAGRNAKVYELDVCDRASLARVFENNSIDAVIHFAGYKAVGESCSKPLKYYDNNINSMLSVLENMRAYGVQSLVFSSSATVYGTPESVPLVETMPTGVCTNPYGTTKLMIEQILADAVRADSALSVALLRYFNPVGAHESGRIGEDPQGIPTNLFPCITQIAVGKLKELSVFGDDYPTRDGTGVRDYLHVVDLARGHEAALEYVFDNKGCEIINLGTGTGYSVLEMVAAFERVNGVKIPYRLAPRRPGDVAECYANADKALRMLGWRAEKTLDDMCRDSWNWQRNNPEGY